MSDPDETYMRLYIKNPRRPKYLIIAEIVTHLGGPNAVAAICLVAPISVSKWTEKPKEDGGSGQDIPVKHMQTILAAAGEQLTNLPLQTAIDELLQEHFLALCYRRAYLEEKVFQFIDMLQGQRPQAVGE